MKYFEPKTVLILSRILLFSNGEKISWYF